MDVFWAKKCGESFFGYINHVKCDSDSEIITGFSVTDASVYDSLEFVGLIDEKDEAVVAVSAYVGDYKDGILRLFPGVRIHICARRTVINR